MPKYGAMWVKNGSATTVSMTSNKTTGFRGPPAEAYAEVAWLAIAGYERRGKWAGLDKLILNIEGRYELNVEVQN